MYTLTDISRKLYVELHETFGADYRIGKDEIAASVSIDPAEIESALTSLEECGMCLVNRQAGTVTLLE
jgi:predicted transcriptional regulator